MSVRPKARADVYCQDVSEGCVLFDPKREKVFVLNATAAFVWTCCDGEHGATQMVEELEKALDSKSPGHEPLKKDVDAALADFRKNGLLA